MTSDREAVGGEDGAEVVEGAAGVGLNVSAQASGPVGQKSALEAQPVSLSHCSAYDRVWYA
jgi:hypothetical protein